MQPRFLIALFLFSPLVAMMGACQHPCQVDPTKCPALTVTTAVTPQTSTPGLIQEMLPSRSLTIQVATQDGTSIEGIGELAASLCPGADTCAPDCRNVHSFAQLPPPVVAATGASLSYTLPATMLTGLPLGPAKLCLSGAVFASADVYVINHLLAADMVTHNTITLSTFTGYEPISFDIGVDASNAPFAAVVAERTTPMDWILAGSPYSMSAFQDSNYNFTIDSTARNPSLRAVAVQSNAFVLYGGANQPPYVASECPLGAKSCTSLPIGADWTVSATSAIDTVTGDVLGNRFIVSLNTGGSMSLQAFSTPLPAGMLQPVWKQDGPPGPVALAAASLRNLASRKASDVIAAAKNATTLARGDVRVFLVTADGHINPDDTYSEGLLSGITAALQGNQLVGLASGDLDGDELADVVLLTSASQLAILLNQGDGSFRVAGAKFKEEATLVNLKTTAMAVDVKLAALNSPGLQIVTLAPAGMTSQSLLQVQSLK